MLNADSDLNGAVVFVGSGQTERTESPITAAGNRSGFDIAVQAIHVAFALVGIGVVFALTEEASLFAEDGGATAASCSPHLPYRRRRLPPPDINLGTLRVNQ